MGVLVQQEQNDLAWWKVTSQRLGTMPRLGHLQKCSQRKTSNRRICGELTARGGGTWNWRWQEEKKCKERPLGLAQDVSSMITIPWLVKRWQGLSPLAGCLTVNPLLSALCSIFFKSLVLFSYLPRSSASPIVCCPRRSREQRGTNRTYWDCQTIQGKGPR